jgi:hypothetical protein
LGAVHGAEHVRGDHHAYFVGRGLDDGPGGVRDTRVVDPQVDAAERVHGGVPQLFDLRGVGNVHRAPVDRDAVGRLLPQPLGGLVHRRLCAARNDHGMAPPDQFTRQRETDPLGAAGNDRLTHGYSWSGSG